MRSFCYIGGEYFEEMITEGRVRKMMSEYQWYKHGKTYDDIYDAYVKPSQRKIDIFHYWEEFVDKIGARNMKIVAAGSQTFSIGFEMNHPVTGELCYAWITKDNNRFCKIL